MYIRASYIAKYKRIIEILIRSRDQLHIHIKSVKLAIAIHKLTRADLQVYPYFWLKSYVPT